MTTKRLRWSKSRIRGDKAMRLQLGGDLVGWVRPHHLGWEWKVRMEGINVGGILPDRETCQLRAQACVKGHVSHLKRLADKTKQEAVSPAVSRLDDTGPNLTHTDTVS